MMTPQESPVRFIILLITIATMGSLVSTSPRKGPACPLQEGLQPMLPKPGADLTLGFMLNLRGSTTGWTAGQDPKAEAGSRCSNDTETFSGMQQKLAAIAATNWPSDSIPLPGLSVGFEFYDVCDIYDLAQFSATRYANKRYDELYSDETANETTYPECSNTTLRLGVIGFRTSLWSEHLSNLLNKFDIPVMSFTSTASELSDNEEYPNFFRVVPPDDSAMKALVSVMKEYNWTYTTMVYNEGSPYGESGFETLKEVYKEQMGYCVSKPVKIPEKATEGDFDDVVNQLVETGIKVVVLWVKRLHVDQIYGAVDRIGGAAYDIQWLSGDSSLYFDFKDLPGHARAARSLLVVSPFTLPRNATYKTLLDKHYPDDEFSLINLGLLINAVHAYMAAFSYAHQDKCGGQPGMCDELAALQGSEFIEYVKKVNFTGIDGKRIAFDENGDPVYHFYEILQYKKTDDRDAYALQKVGEWNSEGLTLNKDEVEFYGSNETLVDPPESKCEDESCPDPRCKKPDDRPEFVIEAFMTLHDGSDCSTLHELRFFQLQSALFAVQHVNNNPNRLTDVRLSINVNDICGDDVEEEAFDLIQRWDFDEGFPKKDNSYLLGVVHSSDSANAMDISETLKIAGVPVIDSGATSPALSDKERFGNFLRTVPSDVKQAKAIVDILERLGLTYIQTVNSKGSYGDGGIEAVKEAAKEAEICIADSHIVDAETNYVRLVRSLLANSDARAVVVFLFTADARALFQELDSMNVKPGRFLFVGSENWGTRSDYIPGLERPAVGALTMSIKSAAVPTFDNYFTSLTPTDASSEIFNEYWMDKFKCILPGSTGSGQMCLGSEALTSSDVNSLGLENTINSVLVYANTLNKLINATCQGEGICDAVYDIPREDWLQQLKDISFTSPLGLMKRVSFDENGDGPPLYAVYKFTEMNGNYGYEEIGTWDSMNGLSNVSLPEVLDPMFSSQCNGLCLECNPRPAMNQTMDRVRDMYFHTPGQLNFPVILPLSEADEGVKCGPPRLEEALVLESLLYTLDKINDEPSILPGIKLGVTVVDSCENPAIATRRLVGLLGDFVSLENTGHPFALLGPSNPDVAEAIAKSVTGPSKFPMITHSAVSPDLYDYPLVLRTSATYNYEVNAIVQILLKMDWKYVAVVFSNTPYGQTNYRKFLTERKPAGICLANQISIDENTNFEDVIQELKMNSQLNVIVAFVDERQARNLLSADDFERERKFTWIGTNSWDSPTVVSNLEDAASGMLVVAHRKPDLPKIQQYFSDMNNLQAASQRNPYFRRYLEEHCGPSISNCQLDQKIHALSGKIASLVDALIVAAHGANWLLDDKCGPNNQGLCEKFILSDPKEVLRAIESRIVPMGASGEPFSFDGKGVPASYAIKNYQYDGQMGRFVEVGEWRNRNLELQMLGIELANPEADKPQRNSMGCSCEPEIQVYLHGGIWTWIAFDIWSTIVLAVSGLCLALALLIGILFLIKRNSYVVQGASFSLSMWLLLGIILMYVLNLAFMFDTNIALCGIRRVGVSFVYCVVFAAMFVKSIRANRFAHKKDGVDLNFAGSWSQSLLFLAFLLPEVILVGEWLFLIPPGIMLAPSADNTCGSGALQTICSTTNIDLTTFMLYAYFLVLLTFLSSIGALRSSHAQHEAKTIFISSLFSICILVAWACVINLLDEKYADPAIPIGLTANATFILFFMFIGKVGSLTKKEDVDEDGTGTLKKKKHSDPEKRPEKTLNVYDNMAVIGGDENGGVTVGDEVTQF